MASSIDKSDKLNIANEMLQFDRKNRDFYDSLTDEEKKKFSNYLMIRWGSSVQGKIDLQEYYLMCTNEQLNKNFFAIAKHPKLQWLSATTVSPGLGKQYHKWIGMKKKEGSDSKASKFLREIYPHLKEDEIDLLRELNDTSSLKQLAREHGFTDERIKKEL
jgi:hypothetical protein